MKNNKILLILTTCFALTACQSVKDGLSGNKSNNSDEFMVKKKNPLILPPKYLELPKPTNEYEEDEVFEDEVFDIQKLLSIKTENETRISDPSETQDAEDFVLKNIKK